MVIIDSVRIFLSSCATPVLVKDADNKEVLEGKECRGYNALKNRNQILTQTGEEKLEEEKNEGKKVNVFIF